MNLDSVELTFGEARKNTSAIPTSMSSNITISRANIEDGKLALEFEYLVRYLPDESRITIAGISIFSGPEVKKAHDEWLKDGRIIGAPGEYILNAINYNASMNAILLARAFNLMPPVILPKITLNAAQPAKPSEKKKK